MKIPLSLIRSFVTLDEPLSVLSEALTLLGIEVDRVEREVPPFSGVIAATVRSTAPHSAANKLQLALVDDGKREWRVVCGAKNCRPGLKVAFAKPGALLYDEHDREKRIEEVHIRGELSEGMLASAEELGIPGESEGLLELPSDVPDGQDLLSFLWDPVFELSLTPNLGHCMSALGIARELAALLQKPLRHPKLALQEEASLRLDKKIAVSIADPASCSRYACRWIDKVRVGPSPFWLQQTLLAAGMRPINNIVDSTNYLLLKTGQPLHAFDLDRIAGHTISVRSTGTPSSFIGLDGVERTLPPGSLLISDDEKILALAGILGGLSSSVTDGTTSILLEAAHFDPLVIRKTARQLALRTESSQRFEKGVDPEAMESVLNEAAHLIASLTGGQIAKGSIHVIARPFQAREITLRSARVNALLGTRLSCGEIEELLCRHGCHIQGKDPFHVTVPSFRNDLWEEIDLVEDIACMYGYNNIEKKPPLCTTALVAHDPFFLFERTVRRHMVELGLQEILTCDLISPKLAALSSLPATLRVLHAKSEEYSILRPSLLPGVLETVRSNLDQKNNSLASFEIGRIYLKQDHQPKEVLMLAIALYGKNRPHHWDRKPVEVDFYDLKGVVESLLELLHIPALSFQSDHANPSFHPGRQAHLNANGLVIGTLGELHPHLLEKIDIKQRVLFAEINLTELLSLHQMHIRMHPLPQFPSTERDWTITLPDHIHFEQLFEAIRAFHSPLFEKVELVDLYLFEQDGQTKRNATIRFTYRDPLKTLSFEEAESVHEKIIAYTMTTLHL